MSRPSSSNALQNQPTSWNENRVARRNINVVCDIDETFSNMEIIEPLKPKTISMPNTRQLPPKQSYLCPANFSTFDSKIFEFHYYQKFYQNHVQRARQQLINRENDIEIGYYPRTSTPISPSTSTSSSTSN